MDAASILLILVAAGQTGWTTGGTTPPPPPAASYDRYAPIPASTPSRVSPPPSVMERAQNAVNETGTAVRDGFSAGIRAAEDQFSRGSEQLYESTRNASQQVGGQLQDWSGAAAQPIRSAGNTLRTGSTTDQSTNPFITSPAPAASTAPKSRNGVAPPPGWPQSQITAPAPSWSLESADATAERFDPTASPGMAPMKTDTGWTSIGTSVPAPRLLIPKAIPATPTNTAPTLRTATNNRVPNFPGLQAENRQAIGTATAETPRQSTTAKSTGDDWATGWSNDAEMSAPTIKSSPSAPTITSKEREGSLSQQQPAAARTVETQQPTNRWNDPWADTDPWAKAAEPATSGAATPPASVSIASKPGNEPAKQPANEPPVAAQAPSQTVAGATAPAAPPQNPSIGIAAPASTVPAKSPTGDQPPWMPLLVVSLSLAGSLGANLFLGWSYLDARQKYQSLVRKTADTFRRVKSAAA